MATNNVINLTASGIASYDGAGTFSALANPLTVTNGGTGDATLVAYTPLCGGTTTTGVIQSVASIGTAGQCLKSGGAGVLPTFAAGPATTKIGYRLSSITNNNPAASTTYYYSNGDGFGGQSAFGASYSTMIIKAGTINTVRGVITVEGTLASAQNCTVAIRLNNSSNTNVTTTLQLTATSQTFSTTTLSLSVVAGDYVSLIFTSGAWTTAPTNVSLCATICVD